AAAGAAVWLAGSAAAQDSSTVTAPATGVPMAPPAPALQLSYGVSEVVRLAQAKVSDDIIVTYVQTSGNAYGLNADQILYLRQDGVSDRVISAMLTQRSKLAASVPVPYSPAPA